MKTQTKNKGFTFAVHDVKAVKSGLLTWKTNKGIKALLHDSDPPDSNELLYHSGYNSNSLSDIGYHGLFSAVHLAFSQHRPLVLSPDMIWIAILQGFAQHVKKQQ